MIDLDAMIEPLRSPLVLGLATGACVALAIAALVLQIQVWRLTKGFFASLRKDDPQPGSDVFPLPGLKFAYRTKGPMSAAQLDYFKHGRHLEIADPAMRARGIRLQRLANFHAIAVVAFVLSMLGLSALRYRG